jgi:hypothetical protein
LTCQRVPTTLVDNSIQLHHSNEFRQTPANAPDL